MQDDVLRSKYSDVLKCSACDMLRDSKDNLAVQVIVDVECLTCENYSIVPPGGHAQEGTQCRYATAKIKP